MKIKYQNNLDSLSNTNTEVLKSTPHIHKEAELVYVLSGSATAYIEKEKYIMKKNDMIIIFPNQVHMFSITEPSEFDSINFSMDLIYGLNEHVYNQIPKTNVLHIEKDSKIDKVINFVKDLDSPYTSTSLCGSLNVIFSLALPEIGLKPIPHTVNNIIKNILDYCLENYTTNISLDILASELHISKYYISHIFNKNLQISFNDYINNLRITKACHELIETDKKIAEISQNVGFGSIRSFNSAFKYYIKCTPRDYRNFRKDTNTDRKTKYL